MIKVGKLLNEAAVRIDWGTFIKQITDTVEDNGGILRLKLLEIFGKATSAFHVSMDGQVRVNIIGRTICFAKNRFNAIQFSETETSVIETTGFNGQNTYFSVIFKNGLICRIGI